MFRPLTRLATLLALSTGALSAQDGGTVSGLARNPDGTPVAGAFVLALRNPDAVLDPVAGALTDSAGRYVLRGLPREPLVLRVRRLGWTLSAPAAVTPTDGMTTLDLAVESRALDLTPIRVVAAGACISRERIREAPAIAAVWASATDAVWMNHAVSEQYALSAVTERSSRNGDTPPEVQVDTTPTSPRPRPIGASKPSEDFFGEVRPARGRRRAAIHLNVVGPSMLTEPTFLRDYCVGNALESGDAGQVTLSFGPRESRKDRVEVNGRLVFDAVSGRILAITYDYQHDGRLVGRARMDIAYVDVDGSTAPFLDRNYIAFYDSASGRKFYESTVVVLERRFTPRERR